MSELWPSKRKAEDSSVVDDLLDRVEALARGGQIAELRAIVRDLQELTTAVRELIQGMQAKKAYGYGQKAGIEKALAELRGKVETRKRRGGRAMLADVAQGILEGKF